MQFQVKEMSKQQASWDGEEGMCEGKISQKR